MNIVIIGAGDTGGHLAKMLVNENHNITVIDPDSKRLDNIAALADVITIEGDITSFEILEKADVDKCDLFISVSPDENSNILAAVIAKQLGAKKAVCRIDNDEYLKPHYKDVFVNMGVDYMFYPEMVAAQEVITMLGRSSTLEYINFSGGRLILVAFKINESSSLANRTLVDASKELNSIEYRTVAILRDGQTIIPHGSDTFMVNDLIYVIANHKSAKEVLEMTGKTNVDVKNMMILGGGSIGRRIAKEMQNYVNIKMFDYNPEKAYKLAEILDKTLVINEDGRKLEVMIEEGIEKMDAFVALTMRSETNILAAMFAKKMGVKKVIAEVENLTYLDLAENMGIDSIINKKLISAGYIYRFTTNTDVQAIKCLNNCDAEVMEFIAKPGSIATQGAIKDINFPRKAIIGGVVRGSNAFIAVGDTEIKAYDRVVVFSLPSLICRVGQFFD